MDTDKKKIQLQKLLKRAKNNILKAISSNDKNNYHKIMNRIIKLYTKAVSIARQMDNIHNEPLIKINKKILIELGRFNKVKKESFNKLQKIMENEPNFLKKIENYLMFNQYNKGKLQFSKSLLTHLILLTTVGAVISSVRGESEIDYNNLPSTIENSNIDQFSAFGSEDEEKTEESAEEEKTEEFAEEEKTEESAEEEKTEEFAEEEKTEEFAEEEKTEEFAEEEKTTSEDEETQPEEMTETADMEPEETVTEEEATPEVVPETVTEEPEEEMTEEIAEEPKEEEAVVDEVTESVPEKIDIQEEVIMEVPEETDVNIEEQATDELQSEYEIYRVQWRDTLWGITKKYYENFSPGNIYVFIDKVLSPLNNKGKMADYEYSDSDPSNPHRIFPSQELKVPMLAQVDPLAIPKELRNLVKYEAENILYTAKAYNGDIIIFNPAKKKLVVSTMGDYNIAKNSTANRQTANL